MSICPVCSAPEAFCDCSSLDEPMDDIQRRFEEFHSDNPDVYKHLVRFTREALAAGHRPGIKFVWERLRWFIFVETKSDDEFKLNNNFHSRYARRIMEQEADLDGVFELRRLASEKESA